MPGGSRISEDSSRRRGSEGLPGVSRAIIRTWEKWEPGQVLSRKETWYDLSPRGHIGFQVHGNCREYKAFTAFQEVIVWFTKQQIQVFYTIQIHNFKSDDSCQYLCYYRFLQIFTPFHSMEIWSWNFLGSICNKACFSPAIFFLLEFCSWTWPSNEVTEASRACFEGLAAFSLHWVRLKPKIFSVFCHVKCASAPLQSTPHTKIRGVFKASISRIS